MAVTGKLRYMVTLFSRHLLYPKDNVNYITYILIVNENIPTLEISMIKIPILQKRKAEIQTS